MEAGALLRARAFIGHLDEEDIQDAANIAFEQFAIRAMEGRFAELKNRTNFFTLLATISARASKNIKRSRAAQKRGGEAKFDSSDALRGLSDPSAAEDIARFEDAEEMAAFFLFLRELGEDEELFRIAELVHTGEIDPEDKMALAERVGISRAGVFRKWAKLCAKWAEFEAARFVDCAKTGRGSQLWSDLDHRVSLAVIAPFLLAEPCLSLNDFLMWTSRSLRTTPIWCCYVRGSATMRMWIRSVRFSRQPGVNTGAAVSRSQPLMRSSLTPLFDLCHICSRN